jgi:hypothetical protein
VPTVTAATRSSVKVTGIDHHVAVSHTAGIFGVRAGAVREVPSRGRGPFHFSTGGTSRRGHGAICATRGGRPVLVIRSIRVVPPQRGSRTERTDRREGGSRIPGGARRVRFPPSVSIADPGVAAFFALLCDGVFLG